MKISLSKSVPEDFGAEVVALSSPVCFALDAKIGRRLCGHFPTETATGTRMAWHRNGDGDRDELTAFEQLPRDMLAKRLPAISVRPIADISTKQIHLYPRRRFFSGGDAGKSPPFADTGWKLAIEFVPCPCSGLASFSNRSIQGFAPCAIDDRIEILLEFVALLCFLCYSLLGNVASWLF